MFVCAGRNVRYRTVDAATHRTPTSASDTRHDVASATMPAVGTPMTLAIVLNPMTVDIARPRSRYGNVSPMVALVFGKIIAAPMPATVRSAMSTRKLVANAEMSVNRPMRSDPATRKRLRPPRSENGPTMSETMMPGAPYAATSRPAVPVLMSKSLAICVITGATTTVA